MLRHALVIIRGTFGAEHLDMLCILVEEHPNSLICLNNLARLMRAQSRLGRGVGGPRPPRGGGAVVQKGTLTR